jgi:hypothetical protein
MINCVDSKIAQILSIPSMKVTKEISISTDLNIRSVSLTNWGWRMAPDIGFFDLISAHMVPETNNAFMLEFHDMKFIKLRSIKTGVVQRLVEGSPNFSGQSAFFLKNE